MLTVTLAYLASFFLLALLFLVDIYMYPICRRCGDNFYCRRLGFKMAVARCRVHGDFIVKK